MSPIVESELFENYQKIVQNITLATALSPFSQSVTLIAVSKTQPIEKIEALYHMGQRDFGENYAQELHTKAIQLKHRGLNQIRWHFLGHLQSNKIKAVLPYVSTLHSLDSLGLTQTLSKHLEQLSPKRELAAFLQLNLQNESRKTGFSVNALLNALQTLQSTKYIRFEGLMCIPDPDHASASFLQLRQLEQQCQPLTHGQLSMGMSSDYLMAIHEGATHIRVGTALFGIRTT